MQKKFFLYISVLFTALFLFTTISSAMQDVPVIDWSSWNEVLDDLPCDLPDIHSSPDPDIFSDPSPENQSTPVSTQVLPQWEQYSPPTWQSVFPYSPCTQLSPDPVVFSESSSENQSTPVSKQVRPKLKKRKKISAEKNFPSPCPFCGIIINCCLIAVHKAQCLNRIQQSCLPQYQIQPAPAPVPTFIPQKKTA